MKNYNEKKILVTGGAGFIGSSLCRFLLDKGAYVTCVDNLSSGSESNIEELKSDPKFRFIFHDVTEPIELEADEIYHMACPASPPFYQTDPIGTARTCFMGSMNMLDLAVKNNARILLTSTSEIYGEPQVHPQKEEYWGNVNPTGIRSCYDEGKRISETLFFDYHRQKGVDIRVARIFNTYGPFMNCDDGRVVSNFIMQNLRGEDVTVFGDGSQTRSFCYVDDTVKGLNLLMEHDDIYVPVNIGNPEEITILQLADEICKITGSQAGIRFCERPKDDPSRRKPDISRAKELLGWRPEVSLHEGLSRTVEYFRRIAEPCER